MIGEYEACNKIPLHPLVVSPPISIPVRGGLGVNVSGLQDE